MLHEPRDPYGAALFALRRMMRQGRFVWGEPLVIKMLSAELRLSATPVREAMACLAGEGLIERRKGQGYVCPALTAADVIDLYDLEWTYVHSALTVHARGTTSLQKTIAAAGGVSEVRSLFGAIVDHTGNALLSAAHSRAAARLDPAYRILERLDIAPAPGASEMLEVVKKGNLDELARLVAAHHRQRSSHAGDIARMLRREAEERL